MPDPAVSKSFLAAVDDLGRGSRGSRASHASAAAGRPGEAGLAARLSHLAVRHPRVACSGAVGMLGLIGAILQPRAAAPGVDGLLVALGAASGGVVAASDVRWLPSRGWIADYAFGRDVLFLGAPMPGAPRDLVRARVRLAPDGRVLAVAEAHNLTGTPLGDDHGLVAEGTRAAFATLAYGQEQSVTILDLEGDRTATYEKLSDRAMAFVTNVQQTGLLAGIGRIDVALEKPTKRVDFAWEKGSEARLAIALDGARAGVVDGRSGELVEGGEGLHVDVQQHLAKPFVFWAVDTARAVPWIGTAPVAWLEDKAFALKTALKDAASNGRGPSGELAAVAEGGGESAGPGVPEKLLEGAKASADGADNPWPPANLRPVWKPAEPGEGEWVVPKPAWLKRLPGEGVPPAFYQTFIRPDPTRIEVKVLLVAMDMRQMDLGMEAGTEDPKPMTGAHGTGRIPRDTATASRVVAAWNGGFKTEHGNYGMMVQKRVLLPPQPNAASVVVLEDGRAAFGTWPNSKEVGGLEGIATSDIVSFRQNLDPLVDRGQVDPKKRRELWGFTLPETGIQTERSGMCVTPAGHVVYAWLDEGSAPALGKAMLLAGCSYGMHLDMNPHHTGLVFANIDELKGRHYKSELLTPAMGIMPDRYIEYAPKDFFYARLRNTEPPRVSSCSAFQPLPGVQPAPGWLPSIWRAEGNADGTNAGVEVIRVDPSRATFRLRGGSDEPEGKTGALPLHELATDEASKAVMAITLGTADGKHPRGLGIGGRTTLPWRDSGDVGAALVTTPTGGLQIALSSDRASLDPAADWAEVPLLFDGDGPARAAGLARAALGTTSDGALLIAKGAASGEPGALAAVLRAAGATRAVLLDRGAKAGGDVTRAGTPASLRARYAATVLWVMAAPLAPRAFRFEPSAR